MSNTQRDSILRWLPIAVTILTNLIIVAYGYGQINQRIVPLEKYIEDAPTRNEFNQRNATRDREIEDLKDRIVRMDAKLDRLLERHGKPE
jgi:hypothetical protein